MAEPRVVFITGCSEGGIGAALVAEFLQNNCIVYASARSLTSMAGLSHKNLKKLQVDVTSDESVQAAVTQIYETDGLNIDVLVLNAGVASTLALLDVPLESAQKVINTNLFGVIRLVNLVAPKMVKRGKGTIVPIGSINGELPCPFMGMYNASKAAVHAYAETLTNELKPFGVHVMLVSPGAVKSKIASNDKISVVPEGSLYEPYKEKIAKILYSGQNAKDCMATDKFAKLVVGKALLPNPPQYFTAGGMVRLFWFLSWLPRPTALNMMWKSLVEKD
ncbi:oxidoreductase [Pholiota conissans]|uniref:Oxidoreductase n=1 Tax=Pholiota conissans TaxID=109636 RepID=A0A9P5Z703_9AGAR|nr:oxidoreductase [Pholiota conissans]